MWERELFEIQLKEAKEKRLYYDTAARWETSLEGLKMALSVKMEKAILTRKEIEAITNGWDEMEHDEAIQWINYVTALVPENDPRKVFKSFCHEAPYKP